MKIIKITQTEVVGVFYLTVWTDEFPNTGFNFELSKILDKDNLKDNVRLRIQEEKDKQLNPTSFKELEGDEL